MKRMPKNLDELYAKMVANHPSVSNIWTDLPKFGGEEPADTSEVWSWDDKRLIVGTCGSDIRIINREDW